MAAFDDKLTPQNRVDAALADTIMQFKEAANFVALVSDLIEGHNDLEAVQDELRNERSIEDAEGVQLDTLGEIVNFARDLGVTPLDADYRLVLRSKIKKNTSGTDVNALISILQFILGAGTSIGVIDGALTVSINIGRTLTAAEISLISNEDLIPRTAGVQYLFTTSSGIPFAFVGYPGAGSFGTTADPLIGGTFGQTI